MTTFTVGPEEGKVYTSKKGYPAKADRSIDSVTTQVHIIIYIQSLLCVCTYTVESPIKDSPNNLAN